MFFYMLIGLDILYVYIFVDIRRFGVEIGNFFRFKIIRCNINFFSDYLNWGFLI